MEIKRQMIDFLSGAVMETVELRLAEREILQVEKVLDAERFRHSQRRMQRSMKCLVIWRVGRSEVWPEHMACGGEWQEMLLEKQLGPKCQGPSMLC